AYLKRIRLEEACRLLREKPHMSVETIAANVGYQTIGQFYKVFRSQFHESPNNWRRNHDGMRSASGQAKKRH
ncbi:MAG: AraC family transcriptional regulator, partial [Clostridia bacterium]|nr:AraC family transcriptional regulator [Clostridia bacterium]